MRLGLVLKQGFPASRLDPRLHSRLSAGKPERTEVSCCSVSLDVLSVIHVSKKKVFHS